MANSRRFFLGGKWPPTSIVCVADELIKVGRASFKVTYVLIKANAGRAPPRRAPLLKSLHHRAVF